MTLSRQVEAVSQLHEHPRLIELAATARGRALVWLLATLLLAPSSLVYSISPLLALVLIAPQWRVQFLSAGSVWVLGRLLIREGVSTPAAMGGLFVLVGVALYLCYVAARSYSRLPGFARRNAQIILHVVACAALIGTWFLPLRFLGDSHAVHALRVLLPFLVWRCGYVLLSGRRGSAVNSGFLDHVFYCLPIFGGTPVPYGKGYDHLKRHRAEQAEALARSLLAGIKLLVLVWLWTGLRRAMTLLVYGDDIHGLGSVVAGYALNLPHLRELIASPDTFRVSTAWLSIFLELFAVTLELAASGHMVIGCLRLFGFNVFRNTYKPLLAQSIVDFWNRFYYYFKELLVEFFFLPTYVSTFKTHPRLRIFAATMAAAFAGNVYYHTLRDTEDLVNVGLTAAWMQVGPRCFYALLLGLGICVSMIREQNRRGSAAPSNSSPLRRIAGVWLFYAIIHIWNVDPAELTFAQRTAFFLSLFGL